MLEVLACGHQSKVTQELFLKDFFQIIQVAKARWFLFFLKLCLLFVCSPWPLGGLVCLPFPPASLCLLSFLFSLFFCHLLLSCFLLLPTLFSSFSMLPTLSGILFSFCFFLPFSTFFPFLTLSISSSSFD